MSARTIQIVLNDECPSGWTGYFVQPDGLIKCAMQATHAPAWTIVVVAAGFCYLAWRDFITKRRQEARKIGDALTGSTSLMVRTGIRIGFHTLLLIGGAYLAAWIGKDLFTSTSSASVMSDDLSKDTDGSAYQEWVQLHSSSWLSSTTVWSVVGAAFLVALLLWSTLARITELNGVVKGLLVLLGYAGLLAAAVFTLMALTAYFGVVTVPMKSEPLAYIYGEWVASFLLLAYAGLSLPMAGETLQYAILPSRPTGGLWGE